MSYDRTYKHQDTQILLLCIVEVFNFIFNFKNSEPKLPYSNLIEALFKSLKVYFTVRDFRLGVDIRGKNSTQIFSPPNCLKKKNLFCRYLSKFFKIITIKSRRN